MSRQRVTLNGGQFVVCGFDRPFNSWYAQLYAAGDNPNDAPLKAIGYHPMERNPRERTEHGIYPADLNDIDLALDQWGLSGDERETVGRALAVDPDGPDR